MKSSNFEYIRASSEAEALQLLNENVEDTRILSGGQSLIPMMNFRVVEPHRLVDISTIKEYKNINERDDVIEIGACVTLSELEESDLVRAKVPLIVDVIQHIAHSAIRNRGTIGGSIALADPAAELPAVLIALNASVVAVNLDGARTISAKDFFKGTYETALDDKEIITKICIPTVETEYGFYEVTRRHGDYASAGAIISASTYQKGAISDVRVVLFGATVKPERLSVLEKELTENPNLKKFNDEILDIALADISIEQDLHSSENTKKMHARAALTRALRDIQ